MAATRKSAKGFRKTSFVTALVAVTFALLAQHRAPAQSGSAHTDPDNGAFRDPQVARGDCRQCHLAHDEVSPATDNLFTQNNNYLCFSPDGIGGCHATRPTGGAAGYPAQESDRFPSGTPWQGYFEANNAGSEVFGVQEQVRWPGQQIWEDPTFSPHAFDADMPLKDDMGRGACKNCHDVHDGVTPYDLLLDSVGPISGSGASIPPAAYALCFSCHSSTGPAGMNPTGRYVYDYYDGLNQQQGSRTGHGFKNSYGPILAGAKLPCYDCHNPHGSAGADDLQPNAFLLSDQRPGWYGLTDIRNDSVQVRRFCSGCHPFSDGIGGGMVEGVALPALPGSQAAHASTATAHCYDCHGRDYNSPTGFNVHNPGAGN
jgi:predicted CXXCH cytochrome family protein